MPSDSDTPPAMAFIEHPSSVSCSDTVEKQEELGWFHDNAKLPFWGPMGIRLLKLNSVPRHIAFIMDGNRRYARAKHYSSVVVGHSKGFDQLTHVLEWCSELGVKEITCYAFSLENFRRSEEEVQGLIDLAERKFKQLLSEKEKLAEKQVRFRFFGNLRRLPQSLLKLIAEIELLTKDYEQAFLNVCMAYTAQDELVRGLESIRESMKAGVLEEEEICDDIISSSLDTANSFPVDMLIRTSGEKRLSDFLLWQCAVDGTFIHFDDALWPDFGFYNLFTAIIKYQKTVTSTQTRANTDAVVKVKEFNAQRRFAEWRLLVDSQIPL